MTRDRPEDVKKALRASRAKRGSAEMPGGLAAGSGGGGNGASPSSAAPGV